MTMIRSKPKGAAKKRDGGTAGDVAPKFYPAMSGIRGVVAAWAAWVKVAA